MLKSGTFNSSLKVAQCTIWMCPGLQLRLNKSPWTRVTQKQLRHHSGSPEYRHSIGLKGKSSAVIGLKVQRRGVDVAKMVWDEVKNINLWIRHTQHGNTLGVFRTKSFPDISRYTYKLPNTPPFFVSTRISCLFLVAAGTGRWDCAKPPQFKRLPPCFWNTRTEQFLWV